MGCFGPLSHYYKKQVDDFYQYGHLGVNKEYFLKLYLKAHMQAFTTDMICSAWKAIGLLSYNPTAVLKTLTHMEPSESQDIEESNIFTTLRTPKTPRTVREVESLYN